MTIAMLLVSGVLGIAVGWFLGRARLSERVVQSARANSELASQMEAERSRVAELEAELNAEQSLLDEVAARNRMTPRAFRETLALDYLHPADPHRPRHLSDALIDLTDTAVDDRGVGDSIDHDDGLADALADRDRALDDIAASLRQLRLDIEAVVAMRASDRTGSSSSTRVVAGTGGSCPLAAGAKVVELRNEVADLRRRLADRQVLADRLSHRLAATEPDAGLLRLSAELADLRARVLDLQS